MLVRSTASRISIASAPRILLRPRFFAAAAAAQTFAVFDEKTQKLSDIVEKADAKSVTYFTATWCGPCRAIAPVFADLAAKNPDIKFIKIDIDENEATATGANITGVPTFFGYAGGKVVDKFSGASAAQLNGLVAKVKASQ